MVRLPAGNINFRSLTPFQVLHEAVNCKLQSLTPLSGSNYKA